MKLAELREKLRWSQVVAGLCALVMAFLIASAVSSFSASKAAYEEQYSVNQVSISAIQSEIEELDKTPVLQRNEIADCLYAAQTAGNKIAMFQNEFQKCYSSSDIESALEINYRSLMPFFDVDDSTGWSVWFAGDVKKTSTGSLKWSFMTNYSVGMLDFPCTWFLRDANNELVAYVSSNYNGKTGLFSGTQVYKTIYGMKLYTEYVEKDVGESGFESETGTEIPAGYHINDAGILVDNDGNPYVPEEGESNVWTSGFSVDGSYAQDFANAVDARRNNPPMGGLSDLDTKGDARFDETEG